MNAGGLVGNRTERTKGFSMIPKSWGFVSQISMFKLELCNHRRKFIFRNIFSLDKLFKWGDAAVAGQDIIAICNEIFQGFLFPESWDV